MVQLLALARDGHRIEMVDLTAGSRRVILTETGWHPDGIVCDGSTIYWTTMGQHTGSNAFGEGIYGDVDGGVHAIDVDGTNRRDIVPTGGTTTGKQLALDSAGNLYWGKPPNTAPISNCCGMVCPPPSIWNSTLAGCSGLIAAVNPVGTR